MKPGYLSEIFVSFQGEGAYAGRRHLFLRLAGCNLRCRYCDTPDSLERSSRYTVHISDSSATTHANPVSPQKLGRLMRDLLDRHRPIDAIAVTGGEPLTQSEFLTEFLREAQFSVPVLLETNGVLPRRLAEVLPLVDIISMDIKPPSNTGEGAFWDEHAAFLRLSCDKDVYVKLLVDQGTADHDVARAVRLLESIKPGIPTFVQPIVDMAGRPLIEANRLAELYLLARSYSGSIRVLPQIHKLLGIR